jgi:hypothetical protein
MTYWILTIVMTHGSTVYGYKFVEKSNCEKIGKELTSISKKWLYNCKRKNYESN